LQQIYQIATAINGVVRVDNSGIPGLSHQADVEIMHKLMAILIVPPIIEYHHAHFLSIIKDIPREILRMDNIRGANMKKKSLNPPFVNAPNMK
jgi:hypothetical protein